MRNPLRLWLSPVRDGRFSGALRGAVALGGVADREDARAATRHDGEHVLTDDAVDVADAVLVVRAGARAEAGVTAVRLALDGRQLVDARREFVNRERRGECAVDAVVLEVRGGLGGRH